MSKKPKAKASGKPVPKPRGLFKNRSDFLRHMAEWYERMYKSHGSEDYAERAMYYKEKLAELKKKK